MNGWYHQIEYQSLLLTKKLVLTGRVPECPESAALLAARANCDTVTDQSEGSRGRTPGTFPRVSSDHPG